MNSQNTVISPFGPGWSPVTVPNDYGAAGGTQWETKSGTSIHIPGANMPLPKELYKKIGNIQKKKITVGKNGRNDFHKYDYVTEADITDAVREPLAENNLALEGNVLSVVNISETLVRVGMQFTLVDLDSGESIQRTYYGDGQDKGDKAVYKAYSGALKYFLSKTFLISTNDDPEADEGKVVHKASKPAEVSEKQVDKEEKADKIRPRASFKKSSETKQASNEEEGF